MDILSPDYRLPSHLDRLTDPELDLRRVKRLIPMAGNALVAAVRGPDGCALFWLGPRAKRLRPLGGSEPVEEVWPLRQEALIVRCEGALWRLGLDGQRAKLLDLPDGLLSADVSWGSKGLVLAALVDARETPPEEAPRLYPSPRRMAGLSRYTPVQGWTDLAEVPAESGPLSASSDGERIVWPEYLNAVPEEAERGEICGFDVASGELRRLTEGAGRVRRALMAPDGTGLLYQANHEAERPITTHTDIWWMAWDGAERRNLTGGGRSISDFGWTGEAGRVWMSTVEGLDRGAEVVTLDGSRGAGLDGPSPTGPVATLSDGTVMYETEGQDRFPEIRAGSRTVPVPQAEAYDDLLATVVRWTSPDGLAVEGAVFETTDSSPRTPLLVVAHGGPAAPVEAVKGQAVRYRHFLRAGYRVFVPAYRGSLGFGDSFAGANIGCQGEADLDDIVSGVDRLVRGGRASADQVGILGGSYGGYMTLRALAMTDRFRAGVARYPFIDNVWMTLETGDFTYITEYAGPMSWPVPDALRKSDVLPHLGSIRSPLLLLHGDRDPICTLSQSTATYRARDHLGVPAGLVVYPGEGHGFRKNENVRDCERRTLGWFLEHLPVG